MARKRLIHASEEARQRRRNDLRNNCQRKRNLKYNAAFQALQDKLPSESLIDSNGNVSTIKLSILKGAAEYIKIMSDFIKANPLPEEPAPNHHDAQGASDSSHLGPSTAPSYLNFQMMENSTPSPSNAPTTPPQNQLSSREASQLIRDLSLPPSPEPFFPILFEKSPEDPFQETTLATVQSPADWTPLDSIDINQEFQPKDSHGNWMTQW